MRKIIDFCIECDPRPPNFIAMMIQNKELRAACGEPEFAELTEQEAYRVNKFRKDYYSEKWPNLVMDMIPYKKPMIANVQNLSSLSEEFELGEVYIHFTFLKPGRHTYVVRKTYLDLDRGEDDDKYGYTEQAMKGSNDLKLSEKLKGDIKRKIMAKARDFYVHELLAHIRPEDVNENCK